MEVDARHFTIKSYILQLHILCVCGGGGERGVDNVLFVQL